MTVIIADFANNTGDTVFDGVLTPVVKMGLEGAGFITVYDRTQLRSLGLQPVSGAFSDEAARQVAVSQGLSVVIGGAIDRRGDAYALTLTATQAVTGNVIRTAQDTSDAKDKVLLAAMDVVADVRKALGDDTSDASLRFAMETLTASLEAVHEYAIAMDQLANGKYEDALQNFSKAVEFDPKFGLAYAGMAIASRNLGRQQDAEKFIQLALERIDLMTERERLRTRGSYYALRGDHQKCVEEYGALINRFPSDAAAHNNLAYCWTQLRNMPKALEHVRQAATILPKRLIYKWNTSMYASYGSDFETGEREARTLQELDSKSPLSFSSLAFAQTGRGQLTQAAATYEKLSSLGKVSASDAQSGLADLALYEGRFSDAIRILERGAAEDLTAKSTDRAAAKFLALGYARLSRGENAMAVTAAENALSASKVVKIKSLAGLIFASAGQAGRAKTLADELASELQNEPQAYANLIQGEIALAENDPRTAIKFFTQAKSLVDTWIGRFGLGRAYLAAGAFAEADSEFDLCIKRRGEALALFLDESPTFGYFPRVYYYQARVREGLKAGFADSYKAFLAIREKAGEDPLLAEARKQGAR
jgi:tetratricopeptide (TPR) repeat protein